MTVGVNFESMKMRILCEGGALIRLVGDSEATVSQIKDFIDKVKPFIQVSEVGGLLEKLKEKCSVQSNYMQDVDIKEFVSPSFGLISTKICGGEASEVKSMISNIAQSREIPSDVLGQVLTFLDGQELSKMAGISHELLVLADREKILRINQGASVKALGLTIESLAKLIERNPDRVENLNLESLDFSNELLARVLSFCKPLKSLSIKGCKPLKRLSIKDRKIKSAAFARILQCEKLKNVQNLNLSSNGTWLLSTGGALATMQNIKVLDLSGNGIENEGVRDLLSMQSIEDLNLSNNRIGDEGAGLLAGMQNVRILNLSNNRIGDGGIRLLTGMRNIKVLNLSCNRIGDEGIRALRGTRDVRILYTDFDAILEAVTRPLQAVREPQVNNIHVSQECKPSSIGEFLMVALYVPLAFAGALVAVACYIVYFSFLLLFLILVALDKAIKCINPF